MKYDLAKKMTASIALEYITDKFQKIHEGENISRRQADMIIKNALLGCPVIEEILEQADFILECIKNDEVNYLD